MPYVYVDSCANAVLDPFYERMPDRSEVDLLLRVVRAAHRARVAEDLDEVHSLLDAALRPFGEFAPAEKGV